MYDREGANGLNQSWSILLKTIFLYVS